jgi:hypothetical protein
MKNLFRFALACSSVVCAFLVPSVHAQPDTGAAAKWGYDYADLLADLERWKQSPHVSIDSIGASTQGRAIFMVTITEADSSGSAGDSGNSEDRLRPRIFWHARTHPSEVQAQYIANAGIAHLLDSGENAQTLRRGHIFHIIPMYNPDGVELGLPRQNADTVDLEGNWNHPNPEAEVVVLRSQFEKLMDTPNPIEVAINLHSDRINCTRFFFYHDSAGTSPQYTRLQQTFIGDVQTHFPEGIEAWHFVKSWTDGFKPQYPESWWWTNHREEVMALTFEDANCPDASEFDRTAYALLHGSVDYIARKGVGIRLARSHRNLRSSEKAILVLNAPGQSHNRSVFAGDRAQGRPVLLRYNALGQRF